MNKTIRAKLIQMMRAETARTEPQAPNRILTI